MFLVGEGLKRSLRGYFFWGKVPFLGGRIYFPAYLGKFQSLSILSMLSPIISSMVSIDFALLSRAVVES